MNTGLQTASAHRPGCGSAACACGSVVTEAPLAAPAPSAVPPEVCINGRRLAVGPGEDVDTVRERAWGELLRQQAVHRGVLADEPGEWAPQLTAEHQAAIETMLERVATTPEPTPEACARYYEAHRPRFAQGQQTRLRHILFAVTPGVPVQALAQRAEAVLLELMHPDAPADCFAQRARELSNCPSGAQGGDLGWVGPQDCVPELAQWLFFQHGGVADGVQPRLVHSRFGLHIVEVLEQRAGQPAELAQVQHRIAGELKLRSHTTAMRQYMHLLVGQARVEGIVLEGAETPLVQ